MDHAIVVLNAGSSSLKYSLYSIAEAALILEARGQVEGLGTAPHFKAKNAQGRLLADADLAQGSNRGLGHAEAFAHIAKWMTKEYGSHLSPVAVGHRFAHGGLEFVHPTLLDAEVLAKLEELVALVPLHQPHNLAAVRGVTDLRPDLPQVACFDTAFHRGRAEVTERFGLPDELFQRGIRRWGFHGLSYQSVAAQFRLIAPEVAMRRVLVAHLGSGASMCAMKEGKSIETTMSFSALDGLPMGTRCGCLDPGVVLFLLQQYSREEIESILYKKSGLLGISGISNDVRELLASSSPQATSAIDFFVYRAAREIGSLTAALNGLDALVFTAGIGENSPVIRRRIGQQLGWLGIQIDPEANERGRGLISPPRRSPSVWVIPTDEESVIAAGTFQVLKARGAVRCGNSAASPAMSSRSSALG